MEIGYYMPPRRTWWRTHGRAVRYALAGVVIAAFPVGVELATDPAAALATLGHVGAALGVWAALFGPAVWWIHWGKGRGKGHRL